MKSLIIIGVKLVKLEFFKANWNRIKLNNKGDDDDWDREMAVDAAPGGKLDKLRLAAETEPLREFPGAFST